MKDVRKWIPDETPLVLDGTWIGEFDAYGTLRQVLIQPENPDVVYDVAIKDEAEQFIYLRYDQRGILASENLQIILFPGVKQLIISNASQDGEFRVKLIYQM